MLVVFIIFFRYSIEYVGKLRVTGQSSPAMQIPMWMMYWSTIVGFGLATIRMAQEIISNFGNFNKMDVETTLEATLKEAKEEVELSTHSKENSMETSGGES
jgi:TRAP-type C4-dicarboxylate transport system permease small subunit